MQIILTQCNSVKSICNTEITDKHSLLGKYRNIIVQKCLLKPFVQILTNFFKFVFAVNVNNFEILF